MNTDNTEIDKSMNWLIASILVICLAYGFVILNQSNDIADLQLQQQELEQQLNKRS